MKYQVSTDAWTCKEKKAKELGDFHTDNVKHLVHVVGL